MERKQYMPIILGNDGQQIDKVVEVKNIPPEGIDFANIGGGKMPVVEYTPADEEAFLIATCKVDGVELEPIVIHQDEETFNVFKCPWDIEKTPQIIVVSTIGGVIVSTISSFLKQIDETFITCGYVSNEVELGASIYNGSLIKEAFDPSAQVEDDALYIVLYAFAG